MVDLALILPLVEAYYAFDSIYFDARVIRPALNRLLRDKSLGRCWVVDAGDFTRAAKLRD